jgi:hypothetical protein
MQKTIHQKIKQGISLQKKYHNELVASIFIDTMRYLQKKHEKIPAVVYIEGIDANTSRAIIRESKRQKYPIDSSEQLYAVNYDMTICQNFPPVSYFDGRMEDFADDNHGVLLDSNKIIAGYFYDACTTIHGNRSINPIQSFEQFLKYYAIDQLAVAFTLSLRGLRGSAESNIQFALELLEKTVRKRGYIPHLYASNTYCGKPNKKMTGKMFFIYGHITNL